MLMGGVVGDFFVVGRFVEGYLVSTKA